MKNILLISLPAVATKMLVKRVGEASAKQGDDIKITTLAESEGFERMDEFDATLLSPHLRFHVGKYGRLDDKPNMRVGIIDSVTYGNLDGEAVLETISQLLLFP